MYRMYVSVLRIANSIISVLSFCLEGYNFARYTLSNPLFRRVPQHDHGFSRRATRRTGYREFTAKERFEPSSTPRKEKEGNACVKSACKTRLGSGKGAAGYFAYSGRPRADQTLRLSRLYDASASGARLYASSVSIADLISAAHARASTYDNVVRSYSRITTRPVAQARFIRSAYLRALRLIANLVNERVSGCSSDCRSTRHRSTLCSLSLSSVFRPAVSVIRSLGSNGSIFTAIKRL